MAKNPLADRLRALSAQLGRPLDTTGTPAELESRIKEAEEELAQLNMPDGPQRHEDITDPDTGNGNNGPNLSQKSNAVSAVPPAEGEVKNTEELQPQRPQGNDAATAGIPAAAEVKNTEAAQPQRRQENDDEIVEMLAAGVAKNTTAVQPQRRSVRLRHTLHVRYYKKGADPRHPGLEKQVDEVVIGGKVIRVDAAEAALLIADGDADAE